MTASGAIASPSTSAERVRRPAGACSGWRSAAVPAAAASTRCARRSARPIRPPCTTGRASAAATGGAAARRDDVLCPAGAWGPGSALTGPAWRRRVERQYAELELDTIVNARWNARDPLPTPPADAYLAYLGWLLEVYSRLDAQPGAPLDWEVPHRGTLEDLDRVLEVVA